MFEALQAGKRLSKKQYNAAELPLRQQLLTAQFDLAKRDYPVIILVAGLEGAGKGALVHRLHAWMDPRGIGTHAFWFHSDEEESRPYFWRFWRRMPPRGEMAVFLGAWYTQLLYGYIDDAIDHRQVQLRLDQIDAFERMLCDDGALLIKLWLHVGRETQRMQLNQEAPRKQQNPRVEADAKYWWKHYPRALEAAEQIILQSDLSHSPWHLIESEDRYYREVTAGNVILSAMQARAVRADAPPPVTATSPEVAVTGGQPTVLDKIDLEAKLSRPKYERQLAKYQARLQYLAWRAHRQRRSLVAVFEGWDAAGKGSAIRRVTGAMDPRLYTLVQFAAPTDEERAHHYFWRFWRHLERDGRATLFDRSWYGRVLVERVEHLARKEEWQRAYGEINQFENQLVDHGHVLVKFWIHIGREEQLRRFQEREREPHKQYKITEEDWRNREKWSDYERAVEDMVTHTSTGLAPWTLVAGNDKLYARIQILKTVCKQLSRQLDD